MIGSLHRESAGRSRIVSMTCLPAISLFLGALASVLAGTHALAQDAPGASAAPYVEEVVVTGSRIRRATSATDTSAPVSVIDGETLADRSFVQVGQALNEATSIVPSRPITPFNGQSSGGGEQVAALFGLGAGRTLTLVNGRRFVSTASSFGVPGVLSGGSNDNVVDTNVIPIGLLSRIEIVQGGGAAVYGSDAMGGVINYILREDFQGFEIDAQYGEASRGDYPVENVRATWGMNFSDRGKLAVNAEWSRTEPLFSADRPESARGRVTSANPANTGPNDGIPSVVPVFDAAFWEFNENGVLFAPPDPTGFPNRRFITIDGLSFAAGGIPAQFNATGTELVAYDPGTFPSPGPSIPFAAGGAGFPFRNLGALYSGVERANLNVIGHYDLTDRLKLSTELLFSNVEGEDPRASLISNTILNAPNTGSNAIAVSAANPYLSTAARTSIINFLNANPALFGPNSGTAWSFGAPIPISLSKVFPDILPSSTGTRELDTFRAVVALDGGLELAARDLYWNVSASFAKTGGEVRSWGIWQSRFTNAINARQSGADIVCGINADANPSNDDPACAPINPFGVGNVSEAARNYVSALFGQDYDNEQQGYLATLGGSLFEIPGGEVKFSVAFEHRAEEATFTPTEASQLGIGRAAVPVPVQSGKYDTDEFSAELLVPLVGGDFTLPLVTSLELTGAFRTVDNSIAGSEDLWNMGARWSIVPDVALRVSRSRNFRAPNLAQLFTPTTVGLEAILVDPCDADRINAGPNPAVRRANCEALFAANPGYGPLATFQDPAENFPSALITRGGNPALQNELSDTWTYGIMLQPRFAARLTIVVDRIEVELTDGLSFFTPQNFLATCFDSSPQPAAICDVTARNASGHVISSSALSFNAGSILFEGETYNVNYDFPLGAPGDIALNLEATHVARLETSVTGVDLTRTDGTATQPDWRARLDVKYDRGPLRLIYTLNYLPETLVTRETTIENNPDPVLEANYRHSIWGHYELTENLSIRAGVENLTDEGPSFPTLFYGDILGRQYFLGAKARF